MRYEKDHTCGYSTIDEQTHSKNKMQTKGSFKKYVRKSIQWITHASILRYIYMKSLAWRGADSDMRGL